MKENCWDEEGGGTVMDGCSTLTSAMVAWAVDVLCVEGGGEGRSRDEGVVAWLLETTSAWKVNRAAPSMLCLFRQSYAHATTMPSSQ